jgi:thiaminase/transcriptional activator TenA
MRKEAETEIENYFNHPYFKELAAGSLAKEIFQNYIIQDLAYIEKYAKALCILAYRIDDFKVSLELMKLAVENFEIENSLLSSLKSANAKIDFSPLTACVKYGEFIKNVAENEDIAIAIASLLPCYWIYFDNSRRIMAASVKDNPYSEFVFAYSGEAFAAQTKYMIDLTNDYAEKSSESVKLLMIQNFKAAIISEYRFIDAVYNSIN